ncbi:MAG: hypothetical protein K2H64_01005, partial [Desulfovibrio sp.]|nr:hypothetical protein [Desulfovibrio sp.]
MRLEKRGILLVSMPWQRHDAPSLQLAILKRALAADGFEADIFEGGPALARDLGGDLYWRAANNLHPVLGECLFKEGASDSVDELVSEELRRSMEFSPREIEKLRREIKSFCDSSRKAAFWKLYKIAAFSCTFNQVQA